MKKQNVQDTEQIRRNHMISYIIRVIQQLDDSKLQNIYHMILHIK